MNKLSEDEKIIDNFKYWFETNTENGVSTIPDFICKKLLDLCQREKNSNQWLLKAFDESRNNNIELSKEYCKIQKELQQEKEKNKELLKEYNKKLNADWKDTISKDKIRDMKRYREFELQQQYKDFENDSEWKTYNKILEEE